MSHFSSVAHFSVDGLDMFRLSFSVLLCVRLVWSRNEGAVLQ